MNSIVIGSGFGGIAAALRLKAKNHKVTLIEKHPDLGGRARVFEKNGFIYDGGPTVITAPYLIDELFELLAPVILIRKSWVDLAVPSLAKIEKTSDTVLPACIALIAAVLGL